MALVITQVPVESLSKNDKGSIVVTQVPVESITANAKAAVVNTQTTVETLSKERVVESGGKRATVIIMG